VIRDNVPPNRPPVLPQWDIPRRETPAAPPPGSHKTTNALSATWNSLLRLVVVIILIGALLIPEVELNASLKLVIIAVLLVLIGFTSAAPLLVVFQALLFFRPSHQARWADVPESCLFVVIVMGLVMFLSRDRTLKWIVSQSVTDLWKTVFTNRRSAISTTTFPMSQDSPGSLVRLITLQVVCVVIAQCLLLMFPLREADGQAVTYVSKLLATIRFPLIILVVVVVIMSELAWRRITAQQASVYLRSTLMTLLYPDLRMVVLRRRKLRPRKTTEEVKSEEALS
jgi:hypothetical protein